MTEIKSGVFQQMILMLKSIIWDIEGEKEKYNCKKNEGVEWALHREKREEKNIEWNSQ